MLEGFFLVVDLLWSVGKIWDSFFNPFLVSFDATGNS
jgi:hypothetical protein